MKERHRTAIDNHCRFAFETCQDKFAFIDADGKASVVLTVNSGYE